MDPALLGVKVATRYILRHFFFLLSLSGLYYGVCYHWGVLVVFQVVAGSFRGTGLSVVPCTHLCSSLVAKWFANH